MEISLTTRLLMLESRVGLLERAPVLDKYAQVSLSNRLLKLKHLILVQDVDQVEKALQWFQEKPSVLDKHLKEMLGSLVDQVSALLKIMHSDSLDRAVFKLQRSPAQLHVLLQLVYALCNTRGVKVIKKLVSNSYFSWF